MLVQNKPSRIRKIVGMVITALGWLFLLLFLIVLGSSMSFEWNSQFFKLSFANMNAIILFTCLIIVLSFLGLHLWGKYNKRRYGHLNRRTFPNQTDLDEIAKYYSISSSEILQLQEENFIDR
ncbi:poly-beta-1,6-N-acetyl-D-glucosamine biosynthesis protein PgaD [Cytobacillus sp. FJAT-53684]|uniref:Poly-beta-1,6-N-acetyl-D-glucosamine biosynthesis protein PgaD n=1 Tax=Cytobacillus mangrovibacter TaxID=3299024 RepID=A0ABW6JV83_9BACI